MHVRETDGSGPGATGEPYAFDLSGGVILDQSPIPRRMSGVVGVDDGQGGRFLRMWAPGSSTWIELHTDERGRIMSDVIIDPGHRIERAYAYP